jgi:hypothetical protein
MAAWQGTPPMSWNETIANCFEADSVRFGRPWIQESAAKRLIEAAKAQDATFQDLEREIVWFCYGKITAPGALQNHIAVQIKQAHRLWALS